MRRYKRSIELFIATTAGLYITSLATTIYDKGVVVRAVFLGVIETNTFANRTGSFIKTAWRPSPNHINEKITTVNIVVNALCPHPISTTSPTAKTEQTKCLPNQAQLPNRRL